MSHTKHTLDMRTIVTPERIIWRFASQAAFEDWMLNNVRVQAHQRKNYRQLLGYDELPNDHVNKREAYNHFALEDTTWMYHADMPFTIPLFGTNPQKYAQLKGTATINMSLATFKRRLSSPGSKSPCGWWSGLAPATVATMTDGSSLLNLRAHATVQAPAPAAAQPPDFATGALGALQSAASVQHVDGPFSPTTGLQQVSLIAASMRAAFR